MNVTLCGIDLDNPIIPASGTFGFGLEHSQYYDINILGSLSFKGTTLEPRNGNPVPRIAECGGYGMINSVGLQNPGLDAVCTQQLQILRHNFKKPVIANISGFSIDEYRKCAERMNDQQQVGIIEVNISCPNVHNGGMSFGTDPKAAAEVTKAVKEVTTKPIVMKLTPNVTDITAIAKACEDAGADGLCLINTVLGMRIDIRRRKPVVVNKYGGYSGPGIFPIALRMVNQVANACHVPIIGCGGISTAEDVIEMMMAGATAVEIGAANLVDPMACPKIIDRLPQVMRDLRIDHLKDIIGIVK